MSVDILTYFNQLLPVLENDDSLYCISAWNDQVITLMSDPALKGKEGGKEERKEGRREGMKGKDGGREGGWMKAGMGEKKREPQREGGREGGVKGQGGRDRQRVGLRRGLRHTGMAKRILNWRAWRLEMFVKLLFMYFCLKLGC